MIKILIAAAILLVATPAFGQTPMFYNAKSMTVGFQMDFQTTLYKQQLKIIDHGPQTDGDPRWTAPGFAIWDGGYGDGAFGLSLFQGSCAEVGMGLLWGYPLPQAVQVDVAAGGGDFAWFPGYKPDGTFDPYAAFCLKWGNQSTTAWTESVMIGKRLYCAHPVNAHC